LSTPAEFSFEIACLKILSKTMIGYIGEDLVIDDEQQDGSILRQRLGFIDSLDFASDVRRVCRAQAGEIS